MVRGQLIKRYFITGLLIWVPLVITGWVLSLIVSTLDQSLRLLPTSIHPQTLLGFAVPGAGAVLTLVMILLTGLLAANFIGQKLVVWWEKLLARIPVVNSVYNSVKQVSDTREATTTITCKASMSASMCRPPPTRPPVSS